MPQSAAAKRENVAPIANPLASPELTEKIFKVVKKAAKAKILKRGVKEVVKALRKGEKGLCIIAGNVSPLDVIIHVPILCEEADVAYMYVPCKHDLGAAGGTKRPTSVVLITPSAGWEYTAKYEKVLSKVKAAMPKFN
jgi:H/ACA ribonucleoprotein complex subunit 2